MMQFATIEQTDERERETRERRKRRKRRKEGKRKGKGRASERALARASYLRLSAAAAEPSKIVRQKHRRTEGARAREMRAPHQINHS